MEPKPTQEQLDRYYKELADYYRRGHGAAPSDTNGNPANAASWQQTADSYETFLSQNTGSGTLKVAVTTARKTIPLPSAEVTVTHQIGDRQHIFHQVRTNESGIVEQLPLPAPQKSLSQTPDSTQKSYASYDIQITLPGYQSAFFTAVPIFDGVESIQSVDLTPGVIRNSPDRIDESAAEPNL